MLNMSLSLNHPVGFHFFVICNAIAVLVLSTVKRHRRYFTRPTTSFVLALSIYWVLVPLRL